MSNVEHPARASMDAMLAAYQDPHALYDQARAQDGVSFDPVRDCWLVTSHQALRAVLEDRRFTSTPSFAGARRPRPTTRSFLQASVEKQIMFSDGPDQQSVQRVVLREVSRKMSELEDAIQDLASSLLQPLRSKGAFDLVADFALPYSLETVCRLFGLDVTDRDRLSKLARWSSSLGDLASGYLDIQTRDIGSFGDFFREQVALRRAVPSDDLIGAFLTAETFDEEEALIVNCMAVFAAGRITTQKLIGDGVAILLPAWESWKEVISERPGAGRRLTEEMLRFVTPTRYIVRHATEDVDLSPEYGENHRISRGQRIVLFLEAANRDPVPFPSPHELDWERRPNPHLAFGHGPHRCPGASMARIEIQIALEALFSTFETLRPSPAAAPAWDPNPNLGGYRSYPCIGS